MVRRHEAPSRSTPMHYDVAIIGAGMSGLAAGIRLAYFDKRVCILEKHYAYGGLNSYYTIDGRSFDVGLHAVTNFAPPNVRQAPLAKLCRQLRLTRDDFAMHPQRFSEIRFPGRTLRFSNDIAELTDEVAREFPHQKDAFQRLLTVVREYNDVRLDAKPLSARRVLRAHIDDPVLTEMLLCPLMYYGSAEEHDMDFTQFVTMFKSILLEGFARPVDGVRTIIKMLVRKYRSCGGKLRMQCGVDRINVKGGTVESIVLDSGEQITADVVFSSAGFHETMGMCSDHSQNVPDDPVGRISFVETIAVLDEHPHQLGHDAAIVFFNDSDVFDYAVPNELVDLRSGVICCPTNYEGHESVKDSLFRVTWLANYARWNSLDEVAYREAKASLLADFRRRGESVIPGFSPHIVYTDMFTPRTIQRFTGHANGAVYGSPRKRRDGRTRVENLFICGTDQGFLGIIGAMLSGVTIANLHVLSQA